MNLVQRQSEDFAEMDELAGAEAVDVDLRKPGLHVGEQVEVPLEAQPGVMPALQQDLRAALGKGLLDLPVHLLERDHVGIRILLRPVKRAELAVDVADVGIVDVAVDDVGDDLVAAPVESLALASWRRRSASAPSSSSGRP